MAKSGTVVKEKEQKKRKIDELRSAPLHKDVVFFFFFAVEKKQQQQQHVQNRKGQ